MFSPARVLHWIRVSRMTLVFGIFVAAMLVWRNADAHARTLAGAALVTTALFTAFSAWYERRCLAPPGSGFHSLQLGFDVLLVTFAVHLTGGALSPFTALYILVTAAGAFLLRPGGALLVAAAGIASYVGDLLLGQHAALDLSVFLQVGVLAAVAAGVAYLSARLQQDGESRDAIEAQLVLAKLQAEDVLQTIRSGIVTVDARGRILFANASAGALLGFASADAVGRFMSELILPASPALAAALDRAVHSRERVTRGEATITLADRSFPIGLTTTIIETGASHAPVSATVIFQDISDSKRLEDLRLRAERLEAVAELSASLAHEIKNPLASIRSAVEQLSRAPRATDDERTLGRLIVRESDRLSRLLSEFLNFARVQATTGRLVDVTSIAQSAAHLASTHPDASRDVRVECTTPPDAVLVQGDEDLLHRALFNIALNAVQASPDGGVVTIDISTPRREQVPVGVPFQENAVMLCVSDQGPGIPAHLRDRVFHPFFTTRSGGTGLGLPIVQRAIEAHRGFVLLDSGTSGTRFTVLLPRYQASSAEAA
jgi:two-component system sensor histidine kinase PilS (NtrC family)